VENTKSDPDTAYIRTINSKKDEIKMLKSLITAKVNVDVIIGKLTRETC
jgi:hypothetical protein